MLTAEVRGPGVSSVIFSKKVGDTQIDADTYLVDLKDFKGLNGVSKGLNSS